MGRNPVARDCLASALVWWQRVAGPYWPYVCAVPFLAGEQRHSSHVPRPNRASDDLVRVIVANGDVRTLVVADLPARRTLATVPELHRAGFRVVPIIQRWVAPAALLPTAGLLAGLIGVTRAARIPADPVRGVVLCLDRERHGRLSPDQSPPTRRFDNRYDYATCRFPPARFLKADRITRVLWLSEGPLADDLQAYRDSLTPDFPSRLVDSVDTELSSVVAGD